MPFPLLVLVAFFVSPGFVPALVVPTRFLLDVVVLEDELEAIVAVVGGAGGTVIVSFVSVRPAHCRL